MKNLSQPERRLLRHLRRIDPGVTLAKPFEMEAAEALEGAGLIERIGESKTVSRSFRITEKGRGWRG